MNLKKYINAEFIKANKKALIFFVIGIVGILFIFLSEATPSKVKETELNKGEYTSYSTEIENKLSRLIASVEGAGKTRVFLTIEESEEYVYAKDLQLNKKDEGQSNEQSEYVIVDGKNGKDGLLIKTVNPKVRGVAVVCEGGDDPIVQQRIYSCVSASLGVSTARISISKMSSTEVKNEK